MANDAQITVGIKTSADMTGVQQVQGALAQLQMQAGQTMQTATAGAGSITPSVSPASVMPAWSAQQQTALDQSWTRAIDMAGHRGKQMADAVSKSWEDGLEAFDQPLQGVVDATDDLGRALGKTGDQGRDAFSRIGQSAKGASQTVSGMSGILSNAFARVLTAVGAVTGAFALARSAGQAFWDWMERDSKAREAKEQRKQAEREARIKEINARYRDNQDAIDAADVETMLSNEGKAVDEINRKYADRLKTINAMSRVRQGDLALEQRMLASVKAQEASVIRQQVLTGAMSAAQGQRALAELDSKYAARAREMESREAKSRLADAQAKVANTKAQIAELDQTRKDAQASGYKLVSGRDFRELWGASRIADVGSQEHKDWATRTNEKRRLISEQEGNLAQVDDPVQKQLIENNIQKLKEELAGLETEFGNAARAMSQIKPILQAMSADGVLPEGMDTNDIRYPGAVESILNGFKQIYEDIPKQIQQLRGELKTNQDEVKTITRNNAQLDQILAKEAATERTQSAEKNLEISKEAMAKSLTELSAVIKRTSETFAAQSRGLRESADPDIKAALQAGRPGAVALDRAERVAQSNYMTRGDAAAIRKALAEVKGDTRMSDEVKSSITTLIEPLVTSMESFQRRARANMTGPQLQESARQNFVQRRDMITGSAEYRSRPSAEISAANKQLNQYLADRKLDAAEVGKLMTAVSRLKSSGRADNKDFADILGEFVRDFQTGQQRIAKQTQQARKSAETTAIERDVAARLRDATKVGTLSDAAISELQGLAKSIEARPDASETLKQLLVLIRKALGEESKTWAVTQETRREIDELSSSIALEAPKTTTPKQTRATKPTTKTTVTEITPPDTTPVNNAVQAVAQGNQVVQSFNQMIMEGMQQLIDVASQGAANTASAMQQLEGMRSSINSLQQQVSQASQRATIQGGRGI